MSFRFFVVERGFVLKGWLDREKTGIQIKARQGKISPASCPHGIHVRNPYSQPMRNHLITQSGRIKTDTLQSHYEPVETPVTKNERPYFPSVREYKRGL